MSIRLIALDLDGTLLDSSKHVSPANREALSAAIRSGIHVVIASGRPGSALPGEVCGMDGISYAITSNGSSIFHMPDMKRIYSNDMPASTVKEMLPIIRQAAFPCETAIAGRCYTMQSYFDDPTAFGMPEHMRSYVRSTRTPVSDMPGFIESHIADIEGIFFLIADQGLKAAMRDRVSRINGIYITSSAPYYLEMANSTVSKASALDSLTSSLGIKKSEVIAFGDSSNDLELLDYAGTGVAMGNSSEELKSAADAVTLTNDEDGVSYYLKSIL